MSRQTCNHDSCQRECIYWRSACETNRAFFRAQRLAYAGVIDLRCDCWVPFQSGSNTTSSKSKVLGEVPNAVRSSCGWLMQSRSCPPSSMPLPLSASDLCLLLMYGTCFSRGHTRKRKVHVLYSFSMFFTTYNYPVQNRRKSRAAHSRCNSTPGGASRKCSAKIIKQDTTVYGLLCK